MSKLPRISGKDCCKALVKLGFAEMRQRGSHVVMRRGESGCVVPLHKELKAGTLSGILKQAGLSAEELIQKL